MSDQAKELILIVDDNPPNILLLGSIIDQDAYDLAFATRGADALDYLQTEIPDLILLDVMMPELDGYTVCERIKEDNRLKDIPIIFLTAKKEAEDIVKGFKVGGVDYITKPFYPVELIARIENQLAIKRAREEIKTLKGIIPICANCKSIRDDQGYWKQVEQYIESRTDAEFSHGICEACTEKLYGQEEWYQKKMKKKENQ